jgi:hypothetical protein
VRDWPRTAPARQRHSGSEGTAGPTAAAGDRNALMHQRVSDGSRSGDHGFVERKPNLAKIPPDGGAGAEENLGLARGGVTDDLLGCLVDRDSTALYRFSLRGGPRH